MKESLDRLERAHMDHAEFLRTEARRANAYAVWLAALAVAELIWILMRVAR